jgi:ATP-dependent DNA helicase RecG
MIDKAFDINSLIGYKENNQLEAKKATGGLPHSMWETYSSFANTDVGVILLGVEEKKDGSLIPVGVDNPEQMVKDIWNTVNNQQKVSVNLLMDKNVTVESVDGKEIVMVKVPRAERFVRPVYLNQNPESGSYRRNGEGDYHCTKEEVSAMFRDASRVSQDQKVLTNKNMSAFCMDTVHSYRNLYNSVHPSHVWRDLDDETFLLKIGAVGYDENLKGLHPTVAGLLMFGYEYEMLQEFPQYFLDYQEHKDPSIRWTDRLVSNNGEWSGNLFDFFFSVSNKLTADLPRPFKLDGIIRVDDTFLHQAVREALLNTLVNADY